MPAAGELDYEMTLTPVAELRELAVCLVRHGDELGAQLVSRAVAELIFLRGDDSLPKPKEGAEGREGKRQLGCRHKTYRDHSAATEDEDNWAAPRLWKCSACGKRELWGDTWRWHGSLECANCGHSVMSHVACSEACVERLASRDPIKQRRSAGARAPAADRRHKKP